MFFLEFPQNFQNSYVKEQLYVHAVGTLEETDGLLKDLIRSALKFSNTWRLTKPYFKPTGYNVGLHVLFHNWCKTITVFISCF